jgi:hypothetical protein
MLLRKPSPKESLADQNIATIFVGTVTGIEADGDDKIVNFKVKKTVKGDGSEKVEVRTKADQGLCGFPFEKDKYFIVYASKVNGVLTVNECSRTNLFSDAKFDIIEFNIANI